MTATAGYIIYLLGKKKKKTYKYQSKIILLILMESTNTDGPAQFYVLNSLQYVKYNNFFNDAGLNAVIVYGEQQLRYDYGTTRLVTVCMGANRVIHCSRTCPFVVMLKGKQQQR